MKKIISMLLASAVAASMAVPVMAKDTFKDLDGQYSWSKEYVEEMAQKGLIAGFDDGTYRPGNDVSRMDAFALFARLMGSNNEVNEEILEAALEKYGDVLEDYKLKYTEGDIAYLLYRGIITEKELDTYFKGNKKTEAMPRYEAAILITKAMLAEDAATEEVLIDMDYADVSDIPKEARQYVYYVTQKGIMNGTGDGKFSPNGKVQRGQIAVMLSKTANSSNYYFEVAKLEKVDAEANNIKIADYDDEIGYSKDTIIFRDGEKIKDNELFPGQTVILTYSENDENVKIVFIDVLVAEVTDELKVIYKGYSSTGGTLYVSGEDPVTGDTTQYICSPNAIITIGGEALNINKIKAGEYVTLGLAGETVVEITSMQKSETIKDAKLSGINPNGSITISHEDEKYDGMEFTLTGATRITKDSEPAEFADLFRGDELVLRLEYGVLSSISAQASRRTITGTLKAYTISNSPTLTISVNGKEETYDIPASVKIMVDGKEGKLADYEIGSGIKITIESEAIVKVEAAANVGTVGSKLAGNVISVNVSAKVIMISYMEGNSEVTAYITCKDSTKYIAMPSFSEYTLKKIKVGDTVEAYGGYQNGIFICTGMTVMPK